MQKRIAEQFRRNAKSYEQYSIIQQRGAELLAKELPQNLGTVLDLGCGSGRVYKEFTKLKKRYSHFYGLDFTEDMLNLHPKFTNLHLLKGDFNSDKTFNEIKKLNLDTIVSSSALQWAQDLKKTFKNCAESANLGAFFLFGNNTFKSLHKELGLKSPIYSVKEIRKYFLNSFNMIKIKEFNWVLNFNSSYEMLKYIKKSGVSGGVFKAEYRQLKQLINNNRVRCLEFETILLIGTAKWK